MNYESYTILKKIKRKFICVYEGESKGFLFAEEFEKGSIEMNCTVSTISAKDDAVVLELKKWEAPVTDLNGEWVQEHKRQFGEEPSFF